MKFLYFACLGLCAVVAAKAQTNAASSMSTTNTAPAAEPAEIRQTEIQCSGPFQFSTKSNVAIYVGNVRLDNPQMKLTCEYLTFEGPKWTNGQTFNRATAVTNVVIDWLENNETNHATSDKAVYTLIITNIANGLVGSHYETNNTVVLTGNAVVTNLSGAFQGDPITYDRISGLISSPNMRRMDIYSKSNSPSMFGTPGTQPK